MRLENENAERHAHLVRDRRRLADDLPMAEMHTVEIAKRIDRALKAGRHMLIVADDLHWRGSGLRRCEGSPR